VRRRHLYREVESSDGTAECLAAVRHALRFSLSGSEIKKKFRKRRVGTGHWAVSGVSESAWSAFTPRSMAARRSPEVCCASVAGRPRSEEQASAALRVASRALGTNTASHDVPAGSAMSPIRRGPGHRVPAHWSSDRGGIGAPRAGSSRSTTRTKRGEITRLAGRQRRLGDDRQHGDQGCAPGRHTI
jgi:hypothetical protein